MQLRQGLNLFKIVLYGPNGEKQEVTKRFYIGSGMIKEGELHYEIGVNQKNRPMFILPEQKKEEYPATISANTEYGFSENLSLGTGFFQGSFGDEKNLKAVPLSLRFTHGPVYLKNDLLYATGDRNAFKTQVMASIGKANISIQHQEHYGFTTEEVSKTKKSSISYSHTLPLIKGKGLGFSISGSRAYNPEDVRKEYTVSQNLSSKIFRTSLRNKLDMKFNRPATGKTNVKGEFSAGGKIFDIRLRSFLNYDAFPKNKIQNLRITANKNLSDNRTIKGSITKALTGEKITNYSGGYNFYLGSVSTGITAGISSNRTQNIGINFKISMNPTSKKGGYKIEKSESSGLTSVLQIRAFQDMDGDAVFSKGDKMLENVSFKTRQKSKKAKTNKEGIAALSGLPRGSSITVELESETIPDIYLKPAMEYFDIIPRSGISEYIDVPFTLFGEIEGFVSEEKDVSAKGIIVSLYNKDNEIIDTTRTEFDGYYLFSEVPLGAYIIVAGKEKKTEIKVEITNENNLILGTDILLSDKKPITFGDVAGILLLNKEVPIPNIETYLKAENSNKSYTFTTTKDGSYIFDDIPFGKYSLDFDNSALEKMGYNKINEREVLIKTSLVVLENTHAKHNISTPHHKDETVHNNNVTWLIDGYISKRKHGSKTPAKEATVYLYNQNNEIIKTVKTNFNGYYIFRNIPAGKYTVSVSKVSKNK